MRRLIGLAIIALIVYSVSQSPHLWADNANALGGHIADGTRGFGEFLHQLVT